ncbi:MAG: hypothetical protein OMM_00651 [Candidatus Magnetoglobus multicellularis str. Araruama]|uniref:Uncharacterized protein n=1 Tax=Candidatus Magnetoglobus multicellularis str. Araruama TaxID=890399 RepID=A0A1V1PGF0_9BACT|nr:MAG: hypothetical protein OMM_00651 [Candidatus Magnetoglobus multicellularis str. Araruama]
MKNKSLLLTAIILTFSFIYGCGHTPLKSNIPKIVPVQQPLTISFPEKIVVKTPESDPKNVFEMIQCGLFFYKQNHFKDSASAFEKAAHLIKDPQNVLRQACLKASAVSSLLSGDIHAFLKAMHQLKNAYTPYQWISETTQNKQLRVLYLSAIQFNKTTKKERKNNETINIINLVSSNGIFLDVTIHFSGNLY